MSFFESLREAISQAFSGGGSSRSDSGSDRGPSRTSRPQQRPSIMTRDNQMTATRDMPRFGISAGETAATPDYSAFSLRGLTSTDRGNVMRNIAGAERMARAEAERIARDGRDESPAPAPAQAAAAAPAQAAAPTPAPAMTSVAEQEAQIEEAGETAAAKARRLGLASTIATSPGGLLAGGQGTTRRRRSLIGGGLIA